MNLSSYSSGPVPGLSLSAHYAWWCQRKRKLLHDSSWKFLYLVEDWIGENIEGTSGFIQQCPPTSVTFWVALGHRWDAHGGLLWALALQGISYLMWLGGDLRQWASSQHVHTQPGVWFFTVLSHCTQQCSYRLQQWLPWVRSMRQQSLLGNNEHGRKGL